MFEIRRYTPADAGDWNQFVAESKNGTFLFDRRYMDYHADRFSDYSLMVFRRGRLYALLPANADGATLVSHQGLTYGGLMTNERATAADIVQVFKRLNDYLRNEGFRRVVYKPVPWIYHRQPSEEDLYALVEICGATLSARGLSSTITTPSRLWPMKCRPVLYVTDRVVHSQYIAANARGKVIHALDLLFEVVIRQSLEDHPYFDFGISTEEHGTYLNEQLIYQKEGFGGRGLCYDWYEWTL